MITDLNPTGYNLHCTGLRALYRYLGASSTSREVGDGLYGLRCIEGGGKGRENVTVAELHVSDCGLILELHCLKTKSCIVLMKLFCLFTSTCVLALFFWSYSTLDIQGAIQ